MPDGSGGDILSTHGVSSQVMQAGQVIGHVCLMDMDAGTTAETMTVDMETFGGVNVLLESSPGNYHCWNLTVRTFDETALRMLRTHADPKHVAIAYRRVNDWYDLPPWWTIRLAPKKARGGKESKPRPKLKKVWLGEYHDQPQSRPHFNVIRAMYDVPVPPWFDRINWVGDTWSYDEYLTAADAMKGDNDDA